MKCNTNENGKILFFNLNFDYVSAILFKYVYLHFTSESTYLSKSLYVSIRTYIHVYVILSDFNTYNNTQIYVRSRQYFLPTNTSTHGEREKERERCLIKNKLFKWLVMWYCKTNPFRLYSQLYLNATPNAVFSIVKSSFVVFRTNPLSARRK